MEVISFDFFVGRTFWIHNNIYFKILTTRGIVWIYYVFIFFFLHLQWISSNHTLGCFKYLWYKCVHILQMITHAVPSRRRQALCWCNMFYPCATVWLICIIYTYSVIFLQCAKSLLIQAVADFFCCNPGNHRSANNLSDFVLWYIWGINDPLLVSWELCACVSLRENKRCNCEQNAAIISLKRIAFIDTRVIKYLNTHTCIATLIICQ